MPAARPRYVESRPTPPAVADATPAVKAPRTRPETRPRRRVRRPADGGRCRGPSAHAAPSTRRRHPRYGVRSSVPARPHRKRPAPQYDEDKTAKFECSRTWHDPHRSDNQHLYIYCVPPTARAHTYFAIISSFSPGRVFWRPLRFYLRRAVGPGTLGPCHGDGPGKERGDEWMEAQFGVGFAILAFQPTLP